MASTEEQFNKGIQLLIIATDRTNKLAQVLSDKIEILENKKQESTHQKKEFIKKVIVLNKENQMLSNEQKKSRKK